MPKLRLLPALACLALCGPLAADELKMVPEPQPRVSTERPARGMSMDKVEAKFGAPVKQVPAVGEPPIERWEYPDFVVRVLWPVKKSNVDEVRC